MIARCSRAMLVLTLAGLAGWSVPAQAASAYALPRAPMVAPGGAKSLYFSYHFAHYGEHHYAGPWSWSGYHHYHACHYGAWWNCHPYHDIPCCVHHPYCHDWPWGYHAAYPACWSFHPICNPCCYGYSPYYCGHWSYAYHYRHFHSWEF